MSHDKIGPRELALRQQREARFARNAERAKVEGGIRKAAAEGKKVLAKKKPKRRK